MFTVPPGAEPVSSDERHLTEREKDVLQCMAEGQARKQIVDGLGINLHTLDYVIRCIHQNLHVSCAAAAVSVAVREGIVTTKK